MTRDDFGDWFHENSWDWYDKSGDRLSDVISAVQISLSRYELQEMLGER